MVWNLQKLSGPESGKLHAGIAKQKEPGLDFSPGSLMLVHGPARAGIGAAETLCLFNKAIKLNMCKAYTSIESRLVRYPG